MSTGKPTPTTGISYSTAERIVIRDADLVNDLMGRMSFTEMILFHLLRRSFER